MSLDARQQVCGRANAERHQHHDDQEERKAQAEPAARTQGQRQVAQEQRPHRNASSEDATAPARAR